MPEISIIVPVYNSEDWLCRCVDSILNQTYKDFELILVDDGSTDGCGKICDDYSLKDRRVRVFHKENGGVAKAKNYGIKNATGEFISFVDSDDYIDTEYLETLITDKNNCDLIICGLRYINVNTLSSTSELCLENAYIERNCYNKTIYKLLDNRALNYHVAKLYRREIINNNSIKFTDFRTTGGDDTVFNFDFISCASRICVINKNIYNYVLYPISTSHMYTGDRWSRSKNLDSILHKSIENMNISGEQINRVLDKRIVFSALWSCQEIVNHKDTFFLQKRNMILKICKDSRFINALESREDISRQNRNIFFLKNRRWFSFYLSEKNTIGNIKKFILKFTPNRIKNIYKKRKLTNG